jgi:hypothetical protein
LEGLDRLTAAEHGGTKLTADEIRKRIESSERAIELADKGIKEIDETLRDSGERLDRAFAELRRAGYLR